MNKRRFDVIISDLPERQKETLRNSYEECVNQGFDSKAINKTLSTRVRTWFALNTLAVVFTFGIYAFVHFLIQRKKGPANLFKSLNASRKILNKLPSILKEKEDTPQKSHNAVHDNSEDADSSFDPFTFTKTAASTAINNNAKQKRDNRIEFDDNNRIRIFHRLRNGNIVIQKFDNTIEIINPRGVRVKALETQHTAEITHFAELENGDIIAVGSDNTTNEAILIQWGKHPREHVFLNTGKVTSLSVYGNTAAIATDSFGGEYHFPKICIMDLSKTKLQQEFAFANPAGKIILTSKSTAIFYTNDEDYPSLKVFKRHLKNLITREGIKISHAVLLPSGNLVTVSDVKYQKEGDKKEYTKSQIAIWQTNPPIEISTQKDTTVHFQPITILATSPDEKLMISVDIQGDIALWDTQTFDVIKTIQTGEYVVHATVADDGEITVGFGACLDEEFGATPIDRIRFYNRTLQKVEDKDEELTNSTSLTQ